MKIAIDASHIDRDGAGIGYVIKGIIAGAASFPEHEYLIYIRDDREFDLPNNFQVVRVPSRSKLLGGGYAWYYNLARELNHRQVDALISPTINTASSFFPRTLQIIHDLTPLTDGRFYSWNHRMQFRMLLGNVVGSAKWLVTISEATKDILLDRYPAVKQDVSVIPLGLNSWALSTSDLERNTEVAAKFDLPEKFFLSVGTVQPRKNYENIIEGFAEFSKQNSDFQYIVVGRKGWKTDKIEKKISELGLEGKVRFLGYVDELDLPHIYDQATAFISVSFEEGFGLPVIEALARRLPILTSNLPVYREIVDEHVAVFADPTLINTISDGMQNVLKLERPSVEEEFMAKYSWENTVKLLLNTIESGIDSE